MKKTITIIFLLLLFITFVSAESPIRELEVTTYPTVDGVQPTDTSIGIEAYIKYLFSLVFVLLGVIFFAILLYNGVKYMISAGSPEKAGSAISGIKGAFLGVIILLSSWMVLNTINPNFWTLEIVEPEEVLPTLLAPGSYLCNFRMENIQDILNSYGSKDTRSDAINNFYKAISDAKEEDSDRWCIRVDACANLPQGLPSGSSTYFVIPRIFPEINDEGELTGGEVLIEEHGLILFRLQNGISSSKELKGGACRILIGNPGTYIGSPASYFLGSPDITRSICGIKLNTNNDTKIITFYQGYSFNTAVDGNSSAVNLRGHASFFITDPNIRIIGRDYFDTNEDFVCADAGNWLSSAEVCGVRSVNMDSGLFTIFIEGDNVSHSTCTIVDESNENLEKVVKTHSQRDDSGFPRMIRFDEINIIKGRILE